MNSPAEAEVRNVTVGIEGGWRTKNLLGVAASEAIRRGTRLAILTVLRPVLDPERSKAGLKADAEHAETTAWRHLAAAAASVHAGAPELTVTTHLLSEAEAEVGRDPLSHTELLVVGDFGQYGRRAFGLESESRVLFKAAVCPVLVVPEGYLVGLDQQERSGVLIGVGEHPSDAAIIQAGYVESARRGCAAQLIHAYADYPSETPDDAFRRAAEVVARALAGVPTPHPPASVLLTQDTAAGALGRLAAGASLLVIGSRPGSLSGLTWGSVGREILAALPCPMLVIPRSVADSQLSPALAAYPTSRRTASSP